jgi:putative heme-binding domain-containing protein
MTCNSLEVLRPLRTLLIAFFCITRCLAQETEVDVSRAGNEKVAEILRTFAPRGVQSDGSQPTPPLEALKTFKLRDGLSLELVAAEPDISQPLFLSWDSRGRMWVVQYRQYQYPAGLKVVRFDQHLRAIFDKVPQPPPHGDRGEDRITVFDDVDGDGQFDTHRDVITGLNIATSVQVGHGGIWVLNPPYLLFYPDRNGDDIPDSDPEVHLSGFGLEDTHSVANSMLWGPDGWLYGANGSTTTGTVSSAMTKGVTFQGQCVWRYHPDTHEFEIYAEGGGNTFSLEIDASGRIYAGYNGGDTRGFYFPQGSYFVKNWGKHGPLTNPYAFGFFPPMKFQGDPRRFPQAFLIYEGGLLPPNYNGMIFAPNSMQNLVWASQRIPDGSTYRTIDEDNLLECSDRWFRPVYGGVGPDGAVYLADWYDTRLSHVSPLDDWHKSSGRVYRIRPSERQTRYELGNLSKLPTTELVALFDGSQPPHANKWVRQRAVLELGWRGDRSIAPQLIAGLRQHGSLECLWALSMLGEFEGPIVAEALDHDNAAVRRWAVRLLGDRHEAHEGMLALARQESDVQVRSQLASSAKRIPSEEAIPIIEALLHHTEDQHDPHLPLLLWWALEAHANDWPGVKQLFSDAAVWQLPMVRSTILERVVQRYATEGLADGLDRCAQLVAMAPDTASRDLLISGLNKAFQGRPMPSLPATLDEALTAYRSSRGDAGLILAARQRDSEALVKAMQKLQQSDTDLLVRIELAAVFGEVAHEPAKPILLRLATGQGGGEPALQRVAIRSLALYDDPGIAQTLAASFDGSISNEHNLRSTACRTLASRKSGALALLHEINSWRVKKSDIPPDVIQQLRTYTDPEVALAVEQAFGKPLEISTEEKTAELKRLLAMLSHGTGDAAIGEELFTKNCATCHQLFGKGDTIAPPLDRYDRGNLMFWLPAIVEPSLEIREGYQSYAVSLADGRTLNGMIAAQDDATLSLRLADNQTLVIDRSEIEDLQAIRTSLMPEDLLKKMSDDEMRHLFAYLMLGTGR